MIIDKVFNFRNQNVAWGSMGDGPPLVLIHGTPFSSMVWRKIAPYLAAKWKVYFFDLLGYGKSEKSANQDVSLGIQNELLTALFSEWGLQKPDVLCHDFGGATALRAHYLNALAYNSLTLIDPVAIAPWGSPFVQHVRTHEAAFSGLPAYAHDALLRAYLDGATFAGLQGQVAGIYMKPWQGQTGQAAFYRQIAQMDQRFTDEVEPLYGPANFPVTLLWGQNDDWIPLEHGKKLAEKLTGGQLIEIPNCGHLMQEDCPEAIVAAMLK
jgi:pimeloyl-ACP methyl ester carboxylesterase